MDIADRLRQLAPDVAAHGRDWEMVAKLMEEAAEEIDRLRRLVPSSPA